MSRHFRRLFPNFLPQDHPRHNSPSSPINRDTSGTFLAHRFFPQNVLGHRPRRDLFRGPKGRSAEKRAATRRNGFSKCPEGGSGQSRARRLGSARLSSPTRRGRIGPAGSAWGTANYYLIARITECNNNGPGPLKAAATTPGINEP